jgi:hypothetical protein
VGSGRVWDKTDRHISSSSEDNRHDDKTEDVGVEGDLRARGATAKDTFLEIWKEGISNDTHGDKDEACGGRGGRERERRWGVEGVGGRCTKDIGIRIDSHVSESKENHSKWDEEAKDEIIFVNFLLIHQHGNQNCWDKLTSSNEKEGRRGRWPCKI